MGLSVSGKDVLIEGLGVDAEARCQHWSSLVDIVAQRYPCCGRWFACYQCHEALADHAAERWPAATFATEEAIYCGAGRHRLTISAYLHSQDQCSPCGAAFNPGCREHRALYFAEPPAHD